VVLAVAIVVVAVFIGVFAAAGTTSTTSTSATVHHGGAHGGADILFKQKLSGPRRAPQSGIAGTGSFGRAHWQQMVGGVTASAATVHDARLRPSSHAVTSGGAAARFYQDSSFA